MKHSRVTRVVPSDVARVVSRDFVNVLTPEDSEGRLHLSLYYKRN
jgi:hypothetical protein